MNGNYAFTWTPPAEGQYTITATFEGTKSYWGSSQTTYLAVGAANGNTSNSGTASIASTDSTIFIAVAAVALIIAAVAVVLAVRKRA